MTEAEVMALILALVGLSWNRAEVGENWQLLGIGVQLLAVLIVALEILLS
jgi:hypothetical protein